MKAVIMAGGFGTRIHPLTISLPKPMIPLINRPIMEHIVNLLKRNGITDLILLLLVGVLLLLERVEAIEARILRETLTRLKWNKSRAASLLGIERSTLDRKIRRYQLRSAKS